MIVLVQHVLQTLNTSIYSTRVNIFNTFVETPVNIPILKKELVKIYMW